MRYLSFTVCLILIYFTGCSQSEKHIVISTHKISIDPKRWYTLNSGGIDVAKLFDSQLYIQPNSYNSKILENYEIWYPLLDGEQMVIDSIAMFDYEGSNEQRFTTIYAIQNDWQRVKIATFLGLKYKQWVGPYPNEPENFALKQPIENIKYLVINTWGSVPTEIELYGNYTPPKQTVNKPYMHYALKNFFGVNGFEWNFENPKTPSVLDQYMINANKSFTCFRHYLDLEKIEPKEGLFTFNPAKNGGWNYDTIYQWCKQNNIEVLVCIKNNPPWMLETYPQDQRDNENIPIGFGKDPSNPMSYIEQAKAGFQFAARYGHNSNISDQITLDTIPRWYNDVVNKVRKGLGLINYIECGNETDKWWKGRKAYQTGREYAANISAFYDGNKNTMGKGVGVKNADPEMKVVMAGVAMPNSDYVKGMIDWCKQYRGYKPDGSIDLPWDIINYHYYSCEYSQSAKALNKQSGQTGVAPELSKTENNTYDFLQTAKVFANGMPVWVTETGYDLHQGSTQGAIPIGNKTPVETAADWNLRTSLLYSRLGIAKVFFYELYDDNGSSIRYGTCGLLNGNATRRASADYFLQTNKMFGEFTYKVSLGNNDVVVDQYTYNNINMYVLYIPDQAGRTANFTLNLDNADTAYLYKPKIGADNMDFTMKKTNAGKVEIFVSETPVFVTDKVIK